jgi:hypothetical protein
MSPRLRSALVGLGVLAALAGAAASGIRQQVYTQCVGRHQRADAERTSAIAKATDAERRAQRALIANTDPTHNRVLREAILAAYDHTDAVRAANPPPNQEAC